MSGIALKSAIKVKFKRRVKFPKGRGVEFSFSFPFGEGLRGVESTSIVVCSDETSGVAREETLTDGVKSIVWVESLLASSEVSISEDDDVPGVAVDVEVSGSGFFLVKDFLGGIVVVVSPKIALLVFCFLARNLVSRPEDWPDIAHWKSEYSG